MVSQTYTQAQLDMFLAAKATPAQIAAAIAGLVNGASTALDTLAEIDAQLAADEGSAAALALLVAQKAPLTALFGGTVNAITATGTAVAGVRNTVDATAAPVTVTLPTPTFKGQMLIIERFDTTTVNAITVTGTIRGVTNATATLPAVGAANEGALWIAESLTSWAVGASIKPKAVLDAMYAPLVEPVATANSGTAVTLTGIGVQVITLTGNATLTFPTLPAAGTSKSFMLELKQDATGGRTVVWPAAVRWPGDVLPVLSTTAAKRDTFSFVSDDNSTWLAYASGFGFSA